MHKNNTWVPLVGRVLISLLFLFAAFGKITGFEQTVGYIGTSFLPAPQLMAVLAILFEGLGGLSILLGYKTAYGAKALILFLLVAIVGFHLNWSDPMQIMNTLKSLAMVGGLTFLVLHGPGELSLDAKKKTTPAE